MKYTSLHPSQIIALNDYPLYNSHILVIYFRIFSRDQGKILPPCPVIHKSLVTSLLESKNAEVKKFNALLNDFLKKNPGSEYFLLDGCHKTTAATLSKKMIPVVVVEKDDDLQEARKLVETGEFFGWYKIEDSIKEKIDDLVKHHLGTEKILTVEEKTKLYVKNKDVPDYMISFYNWKKN